MISRKHAASYRYELTSVQWGCHIRILVFSLLVHHENCCPSIKFNHLRGPPYANPPVRSTNYRSTGAVTGVRPQYLRPCARGVFARIVRRYDVHMLLHQLGTQVRVHLKLL